jgi:hypothetical protein
MGLRAAPRAVSADISSDDAFVFALAPGVAQEDDEADVFAALRDILLDLAHIVFAAPTAAGRFVLEELASPSTSTSPTSPDAPVADAPRVLRSRWSTSTLRSLAAPPTPTTPRARGSRLPLGASARLRALIGGRKSLPAPAPAPLAPGPALRKPAPGMPPTPTKTGGSPFARFGGARARRSVDSDVSMVLARHASRESTESAEAVRALTPHKGILAEVLLRA